MELRVEISIDAPAEHVWEALGERFMHISEWAAPIISSCPVGPGEPRVGATRRCVMAPFGPIRAGVVQERLTSFDRARMAFEYEGLEGMPRFVRHATNRWRVEPAGDRRSLVRIQATLTLHWAAWPFAYPIRWQLESGGAQVAEELKHFVERGEPHPRKRAAAGKLVRLGGVEPSR